MKSRKEIQHKLEQLAEYAEHESLTAPPGERPRTYAQIAALEWVLRDENGPYRQVCATCDGGGC